MGGGVCTHMHACACSLLPSAGCQCLSSSSHHDPVLLFSIQSPHTRGTSCHGHPSTLSIMAVTSYSNFGSAVLPFTGVELRHSCVGHASWDGMPALLTLGLCSAPPALASRAGACLPPLGSTPFHPSCLLLRVMTVIN